MRTNDGGKDNMTKLKRLLSLIVVVSMTIMLAAGCGDRTATTENKGSSLRFPWSR